MFKSLALGLTMLMVIGNAASQEYEPTVIEVKKITSKMQVNSRVAGLINMDTAMNEPGSGCSQMIGRIKVESLQFSKSGVVLESFYFTDAKGNVYSVPTNIEKLPNALRSQANSFIRQGRNYFAHIKVCGSGGFASLINLYDLSISIGAFD